jgi:DNA-binding CsgD family transcriptional regulator
LFLKQELQNKKLELSQSMAEAKKWKEDNEQLIKGLSFAIDKKFEEWSLSPSEKDVALLLLKGLSLKEIADIRSVSERTVRQQSINVYQKAKLSGRAELSAFFLEDLLANN